MTREPVIDLDDVFVLYPGERRDVAALRGLSLSVQAGERIVIHGPSGAGKSTFVKLITAALVPNAGSARLFGRELSALDDQARAQLRREAIGTITQHSGDDLSPELTCLENVALQPRLRGWSRTDSHDAAITALQAVGLDGFGSRRPKGLSHGELQRVGIAAALAHRPHLIVADEPTGQLDVATADVVFDLLARIAETYGTTLILATHDESAARLADRILTIADGRLSSERRRDEVDASVVIDRRGWLRLPAGDVGLARLGDRATVSSQVGRVTISAGASPDLPANVVPTTAVTAGPAISTLVEVTFVVNGTIVLQPTSIQVRTGQLHAVTGRSGSGKTTLLSLITGWLRPTGGNTTLDSKAQVAVCPAVPVFADGMSVTESLRLAARIRGIEPDPQASAVLLSDLGLTDLAGRSVNELSGGERQRLAVGRCLATGANLLVFDEPTAQLDRATAQRIVDLLIRAASEGRAVVCATHDSLLCDAADAITEL